MFDPARDDDGHRPFARRLLLIAVAGALASVALWPSISGFPAGVDGERTCVAVLNAWGRDVAPPSAADIGVLNALPAPPPASDPAAVARFRQQWNAIKSTAAYRRANVYMDWQAKDAECVHESRHRLILSGIGLGVLTALVVVTVVVRARQAARRRAAALASAV